MTHQTVSSSDCTHHLGDADRPASVELWFADLTVCGPALDAIEHATPRLSPGDIKKISGSASPAHARERRAAYIALRLLIERHWGPQWRCIDFTLTGTGKPLLPGATGGFSLAHVDCFALIGIVAEGTIGVDLEPARQPIIADERRCRIEDAARVIARCAALPELREPRFLQAWVRLEAVAKADGRGIGRLLTGLGVLGGSMPDTETGRSASHAEEIANRFWVQDLPVPQGCVAAAALGASVTAPAVRHLPSTSKDLEKLVLTPLKPSAA